MASTERKLAAILSADVVEYSRLMAEDESRDGRYNIRLCGISAPSP